MVEEVSEGKKQRGNEISGISTAIHLPLTVKEITFTGAQSYIGFDFAERNLESGDFDEIKDENKALWENMLSRVEIEGDEELFGGREAFLERLEGLFETENEFYVARWNRAIHEMAEYSEEKWGAVAISNEPSFHIPFIFALLGEKEKASYWVKRIATEAFSYKDDGFPGDEDNGAMALWFCLAVMGIYPVCPGKDIFTVTDKLCERIKIGGRELNLSNCGNLISYKDLMDKIR